jgi:hypothetical protein
MAAPTVVLVCQTRERPSAASLDRVARALQTQVDRDLEPVWGVRARVAVASGSAVPPGAWPIHIVDEPRDGLGIHLDAQGRPYAEARAGADWSQRASHELLEMLADPDGRRFMLGRCLMPRTRHRQVGYLVEVCDPCQVLGYTVDGVRVSNFVTPDYYRADAPVGTALDFMRELRRPLQVPRGCYLSWQDPGDGYWHQRGPDGAVSRSSRPIDPRRNPREDRDQAYEGDARRHDLSAVLRKLGG